MKYLRLIFLVFLFFPISVFAADTDGDFLSDEEEIRQYTDFLNPDTDGDGYDDGFEIQHGYSPLVGEKMTLKNYDHDKDGLNDWQEMQFGTDLGRADSDSDGHTDITELLFGFDPLSLTATKTIDRTIIIDRTTQTVRVEVNGISLKQFPVSTGNPVTPTPSGEFVIERKVPFKLYMDVDYYYPNVKWNLQFKKGYYLHTAYWHNDFGKRTRSHGCVNMREADAKFLYDSIDVGTKVLVTGETPKKKLVVGN